MKVNLKAITPNIEETIVEIARVSSSRKNKSEAPEGLINYLIKNWHFSPFEHGYITMEIETSKAIGIQLLRHRSFTFQEFCISGDSLVKLWYPESKNSKQVPIKDLYKRFTSSYWDRNRVPKVKVFDEDLKTFVSKEILEVFKTGEKDLYEVELDNGKKIKATKEHKFLTNSGFNRLEGLKVGDFLACNGVVVHHSKEWMEEAKKESLTRNGVQYIADKAGVSYHTIRKWLRIHGLQFTRKEISRYTEIWNKRLPKSEQPMYGKSHTYDTRMKQRESSRKGSDSNLYTGSDVSWRKMVTNECIKQKAFLAKRQGILLEELDKYEVDHIKPVYSHPELALDINNLQLLTKEEHTKKSEGEMVDSKYTVSYSPIKSIRCVGKEMTYDLEVNHKSHNYVANGIVTHNSQRYQDVGKVSDSGMFEDVEIRKQATNNRQSSEEVFDPFIKDPLYNDFHNETELASKAVLEHQSYSETLYNNLLEGGVAREQARMVLPMATKTRIYMTGSIRSWLSFLNVRLDQHAQVEIREVANEIADILQGELPLISSACNNFNYRKGLFM